MEKYLVTFYNMGGESLGTVEVLAPTESKAKIEASKLYTCSFVSQGAVPAVDLGAVAKATYEAADADCAKRVPWESLTQVWRDYWVKIARVVIAKAK